MAYASWSVVAGEQPSASKWNILGTNDAYFDSLIGSGTTFTSATPTWTNLNAGSGGNFYNTIYYQQIGKWIHGHGRVTLGTSGSSVGTNAYFILPVSISTTTYPTGATYGYAIGTIRMLAGSTHPYSGYLLYSANLAANAAQPAFTLQATAELSGTTSTSPATWTAGDYISYTFSYEVA